MTKSPAWNVIGVDFDAKQLAEEAARRADLPVGEWLARIISEKAAEASVSDDADDEGATLEAITASLARARPRRANRLRPRGEDDQSDDVEADEGARHEDDDVSSRSEPPRRRNDPREASFAGLRRRARPAPGRPAEPREATGDELKGKLGSVERRLAAIENALALLLEDMEEREASAAPRPLRSQPVSPTRMRR